MSLAGWAKGSFFNSFLTTVRRTEQSGDLAFDAPQRVYRSPAAERQRDADCLHTLLAPYSVSPASLTASSRIRRADRLCVIAYHEGQANPVPHQRGRSNVPLQLCKFRPPSESSTVWALPQLWIEEHRHPFLVESKSGFHKPAAILT